MPPSAGQTGWRRNLGSLVPIYGSLLGACVLIFFDMVLTGSYAFSALTCPVWFVISLVKARVQRRNVEVRVAVARVLVPAATLAIVLANAGLQREIANSNAERITKACESFHAAHGVYPNRLADLVPQYLGSIPRAKYRLIESEFEYYLDQSAYPMLWWRPLPYVSTAGYNFGTGQWFFLD